MGFVSVTFVVCDFCNDFYNSVLCLRRGHQGTGVGAVTQHWAPPLGLLEVTAPHSCGQSGSWHAAKCLTPGLRRVIGVPGDERFHHAPWGSAHFQPC